MARSKKNRFTLKIIASYLVLVFLTAVVGFFIYSEINHYLSEQSTTDNDEKLLRTGSLLIGLYKAETLSRLALQTKTRDNFSRYEKKIDSLLRDIDTLKANTTHERQKTLLDSIEVLLKERVANNNELRNLKMRSGANNSLDEALQNFRKLEASLGKITPEGLAPNYKSLSPKAREVIEDIADYLNENIPDNARERLNRKQLDSILELSKGLITEARRSESRSQLVVQRQEEELLKNDLALSQQLKNIVSATEDEVLLNSLYDTQERERALQRSFRIAVIATVLGLGIVVLFTFLIHKDYWQVQNYRRQLEKQKGITESLLKSREQLISTVGHDLRTPLNAISGYSELMEATSLNPKQRDYLTHLRSATGYVDRLVTDLLDFSKLASGRLKIDEVAFSLPGIIRETSENLEKIYAGKKGISLILEIAPELERPVVSDPFRIRQILSNLIGNAFKFTQQGTIMVRAGCSPPRSGMLRAKIEVIDSGIGIPKHKQEIIFQEFQQADEQVEKTYGGYGLGLTISKKLAELLGGSLEVRSKPGKGSTFTLQIPLRIAPDRQAQEKSASPTGKAKESILIFDDDPAMLQLLEDMCQSLGMSAITYSDFNELPRDREISYGLVLTDIQMPAADGFEVLRRLKSNEYSHYTGQPIIAMTGRRHVNLDSYRKKGFADVLQKPFRKQTFEQVLQRLGRIPGPVDPPGHYPVAAGASNGLFSLDAIRSFLGDDSADWAGILETFIRETRLNLKRLKKAVNSEEWEEMQRIAHRMLPMFRQLQAIKCIGDLEILELGRTAGEEKIPEIYRRLAYNAGELVAAQENLLKATSPDYNG